MAMWQQEYEAMPREEIRKLQSERLKWQVARMYENVELFRKRMDEKGLKPEDINGVEDLHKLPFSYKQDLRDYYPYGLFAVPTTDIRRVHASSGTTGKQIVVGYTDNDLEMWADCFARMLIAVGADKDSFVHVGYGLGLFTGGFGAHDGAVRIGATAIPISAGNTPRQIQTMIDFGSTVLCCTPSYAMYLGETIEEMGVKDQLKLKAGIFGAEPWTEEMRRGIEATLGIKAYDIYGLTEIIGPGVGYECECQNGTHLNEDHFYPEIVDPETGEPVEPGQVGELVFTTLTKEGMPLIRFRTRDLTALHYEKCSCGRTFVRMDKILGRCDDMLIIRGVNVFPSQIEAVICETEEFEPHFFITVDRINNTDTFEVQVEVKEAFYSDDIKSMLELKKKIAHKIQGVIGIQPDIKLVEPRSLQRSEGKAKRVLDKRVLV